MIKVKTREAFLIELKGVLHNNVDAVELGVHRGDFAMMILNIIRPRTLVLIDPFKENDKWYGQENNSWRTAYSTEEDYQEVKDKFATHIFMHEVIVDRNYSYDAVHKYADDTFDLIYIDASHLYPDVKKDLNDWLPKLSINGYMCGHDCNNDNGFGVVKAVDEFMEENNFEMILFNETEGDFALRRK